MTEARFSLSFAASRYFDRMLSLQLGEISPEGIDLSFSLASDLGPGSGFDLVELPIEVLLAENRGDGRLVGLPVFPGRRDSDSGRLEIETVIALSRDCYQEDPWIANALLDAFEAARQKAYARLKLVTSPALALPWLVDYIAEDERRFGGDPWSVGFAANRPAIEEAGGREDDFAPEAVGHKPVARAVESGPPVPDGDVRCRAIRYCDRSLPLETGEVESFVSFRAVPGLGGQVPAVATGKVDVAEILLGDLLAEVDGDNRIVGLPIFTARRFPHRMLWVAKGSPFDSFDSLHGQTIGYPPGSATAVVWIKAMLNRKGVVSGFTAGPLGGKLAKILDRDAEGRTLQERIRDGEIDAIISPYAVPSEEGGSWLRPLLADPASTESAEAAETGIPPVSNVLAMNRDKYESDPLVASGLVDAFRLARALGAADLTGERSSVGLPHAAERSAATLNLFGHDPYPVGIKADRESLSEYLRHAADLEFTSRELTLEEIWPE